MAARKGGLVYSTESGRMCPDCGKPIDACVCKDRAGRPAKGDGIVRVARESKGRGGKVVTVVRGLDLDAAALAALGKELRSTCGSGGTVKEGALEIQGDHVARVMELLVGRRFTVKRVGG